LSSAWSCDSYREEDSCEEEERKEVELLSHVISHAPTTHLLQKASQFPFAFTGDKCFASFTMMCSEPFVFFEHDVGPVPPLPLLTEEFDLMLNFRRLRPCECVEPEESAPGMNFRPTMMSPR
jgi:hypothetical protein